MKRKKVSTLIAAALALTMTVCSSSTAIATSELTAESKPATQYTIDANQEVYALLDFEDTAEFENATKGLLLRILWIFVMRTGRLYGVRRHMLFWIRTLRIQRIPAFGETHS